MANAIFADSLTPELCGKDTTLIKRCNSAGLGLSLSLSGQRRLALLIPLTRLIR